MTLVTHGCRLNIAESDDIAALIGVRDDLIVINSCAVTAEAVAQARKAIRKAARERPDARIVVTGCAATTEPETFAAMAEVAAVVPNAAKLDAAVYSLALASSSADGAGRPLPFRGGVGVGRVPHVQVSQPKPVPAPASTAPRSLADRPHPNPSPEGEGLARVHTRAFIEVQNGCDHDCTFCIIPVGRGASRSTPAERVIDRIRAAIDGGAQEVVLTGVDVTAYGADIDGERRLGDLVGRILREVPDLPRLRLSSLDAVELDERLIDLIGGEPRIMPHLHLSLQHGHDMMLKRMKRRHSRAQAIALVDRLKRARPGLAIGADLIAGFPTETPEMHAASLDLLDACDVVHAHIFPYSPRAGTPAARMPQVKRDQIMYRARELRAKAAARHEAWLDGLVGSTQQVLIERGGTSGHAENFGRVAVSSPAAAGAIRIVTIFARKEDQLIGTLA